MNLHPTRRQAIQGIALASLGTLTACSISNRGDANLATIINTSVEAVSDVQDSQLDVDYYKSRIMGTQHADLTGTILYVDDLEEQLPVLLKRSLVSIRDALSMSDISKGKLDITGQSGQKTLTVADLLDVKKPTLDDISNLESNS